MRIATLLVLSTLLAPAERNVREPEPVSQEELAVIAAAIDSLYVRDPRAAASRIVIDARTAARTPELARAELQYVPVSRELSDDFVRRNEASAELNGLATLMHDVTIDFARADSLLRLPHDNPDDLWAKFYQRFPGSKGLINVSRPGIAGANAFLLIGRGCGGRCGAWGYATLRKDGGRWRLERFVIDRMS